MEKYYEAFEGTTLYKNLVAKAEKNEVQMVEKAINFCYPLLSQYIKTFPTYTLHNDAHQKNILELIEKLLGNKVESLTGLETAIIILSIFFHDIGMVFDDQALGNIKEEPHFDEFLKSNYKARLSFEKNEEEVDADLAEWYCRWVHARRVWLYLDKFEQSGTSLEWNGFSIKKELGMICESHNNSAKSLNDSDFDTGFLNAADLRFCAVMLRLGDILDFDNSRTPQSVYEFLQLETIDTQLGRVSRIEWKKHLASRGFTFKKEGSEISLSFMASPDHPSVQKSIEQFLDTIEEEVRMCSKVLPACSPGWRDLKIDATIDRSNIKPQGYKGGRYQLSLDEKQIINLLTGENLYESPYEFIRELLQNAIDSSRMREFHEHANKNTSFLADPVQLTSWVDSDGYRWVRIDDFGMGMNEFVIVNHLLKKGNSYYKSPYFQLQQLHYQKISGKSFTPISRFGIGLLSCFILGDKIEISTRSVSSEQSVGKEEQIRLSIDGMENQYILQTQELRHQPLKMPAEGGKYESDYRKSIGTSIAVRINRTKDHPGFDREMESMLRQCLTCSPVAILYNHDRIGVDFDVLDHPFTTEGLIPFPPGEIAGLESFLGKSISEDSGIEIITLDLTKDSMHPNLKGQVALARVVLELPKNIEYEINEDFLNPQKVELRLIKRVKNRKTQQFEIEYFIIDLNFAIQESQNGCRSFVSISDHDLRYINSPLNLVHNGINIPNEMFGYHGDGSYLGFDRNLFSSRGASRGNGYLCWGIVYLQDELIPDLSIARNAIKNLSFSIMSAMYYATRKVKSINGPSVGWQYLTGANNNYNHKDIARDYLVKEGYWDQEAMFYLDSIPVNVEKLKEKVLTEDVKLQLPVNGGDFFTILRYGLLQIHFDVVYEFLSDNDAVYLLRKQSLVTETNDEHESLMFLPFQGSDLITHGRHFNTNHKLIKWMMESQDKLRKEFLNYYLSLVISISNHKAKEVNSILDFFRGTFHGRSVPDNVQRSDFPVAVLSF